MAQDAVDFQPHRRVACEVQDNRAALRGNREQFKKPVGIASPEAAVLYGGHRIGAKAGMYPLEILVLVASVVLPAKPVRDEKETLFVRKKRDVGDRDERILQHGGKDGDILVVLSPQTQQALVSAHRQVPSPIRSIRAPQAASLSSSRS